MTGLSERVWVLCLAVALAPSMADAAKYSGSGTPSLQFSSEPNYADRKAPPPEASQMPMRDLRAAAPVRFPELRRFVADWRKYSRWLKTDGNQFKAVAYLGVSKNADYPVEVVRWMDEHGWAADRFFLLERKFRITLSVMAQENKQTSLLNHLELQIRQLDSNSALGKEEKERLREQYVAQTRSVRAATSTTAPVSPEEYELIKMNRAALTKILAE